MPGSPPTSVTTYQAAAAAVRGTGRACTKSYPPCSLSPATSCGPSSMPSRIRLSTGTPVDTHRAAAGGISSKKSAKPRTYPTPISAWIITRSISHMRRLDRCQRSVQVKPVHQYPAPDRRVVVGAQAGASTVAITSPLVVVGDVPGEADVRVLERGGAERVLLGGAGVDQALRPGDALPGASLVQPGDKGVPDADRRVQPGWGLGG